jgi:hypothetical protein
MKRQFATAATLAMLFSGQAAALDWSYYLDFKGQPMTEALLISMGQSYMFANFELEDRGAGLMYCQPENLALTGAQYTQILDQQALRIDPNPNTPVELLLLEGLKYTFPC